MAINLKTQLESVNKDLKALSKKVEKMLVAANNLEKPKATKAKPAKKAVARKEMKMTAPETVMGIIKRSRKGVAIETLKEKTGFHGQKLYSVVYTLKKQGKIKAEKKGFYVKA